MFGFKKKKKTQKEDDEQRINQKEIDDLGMEEMDGLILASRHVHKHMPACPKTDKQRLVISLDDFREIPETPAQTENVPICSK